MQTIFKYELQPEPVVLDLPEGYIVRHVASPDIGPAKERSLFMWVQLDTEAPKIKQVGFTVVGTGQWIDPDPAVEYVGTALMGGGVLVWHVFKKELN